MTPTILLESFRSRGVRLEAQGLRLHYVGSVTAEDLTLLRTHKAELLTLLRAEHQPAMTTPGDNWADNVPHGPCGLCGAPLAWVEDWPTAGEVRWLCLRCAAQPAPSLRAVFATLTPEERQRLADERDASDPLAVAVLAELEDHR